MSCRLSTGCSAFKLQDETLNTYMLTFRDFLTEKFLKGADTMQGYVELWINPTRSELAALAHHSSSQIGAYLTPRNLYVWDRDIAEHQTVYWCLPEEDKPTAPLYLYYNPQSHAVKVTIASWSLGNSRTFIDDDVVGHCKTHPAFRIFTNVTLG
jgi:hypothetical protein